MGWDFEKDAGREKIIAERCRSTVGNAVVVYCLRGNVLWTINVTGERPPWIGCTLLRKLKDYGWGSKELCESMGPCYYTVPLGWLEQVPVACEGWREKVRAYHARVKERRVANAALKKARGF